MSNILQTVVKRGIATSSSNLIKNVVVIGTGLMGSGIAQVAASNGHVVTIVDQNQELINKANKVIAKNLERVARKQFKDNDALVSKMVHESLDRIDSSTDVKEAVLLSDIVIEAIVENLKVKQELFASIDDIAPKTAIFASNTSSLPISDIAAATKRPDRFCGLHFFNPVPVMKLLEVIRTSETSEETYNKVMEFGKNIGKACITCKDTPGFVVNRLLVPYLGEAMRMLERGDASARDIDTAMKLGAGYPMGPFELADYVGLDTTLNILKGWHEKFPENPLFNPIPTLDRLVSEGKLGVKSGEGIYSYKK
jgi:3-hydroxyacyl-CoA dehydrogenase